MYNSKATIRQGFKFTSKVRADADSQVLKKKRSLNWTGPIQILAVGIYDKAPDGSPVPDKLLYLDLPSDMPGADAKRRFSE